MPPLAAKGTKLQVLGKHNPQIQVCLVIYSYFCRQNKKCLMKHIFTKFLTKSYKFCDSVWLLLQFFTIFTSCISASYSCLFLIDRFCDTCREEFPRVSKEISSCTHTNRVIYFLRDCG